MDPLKGRHVGQNPSNPKVVVVAYEGLCTFEFGIAVEVFGLPRPEVGANWYRFQVCSADGPKITCVGGVQMVIEAGLEALQEADIVILPGWRGPDSSPSDSLVQAVVKAHSRGARIVAICGGVFALAATGLLANRCATTHWRFVDILLEKNPDIRVENAPLFCDDDRLLTSAGSAAGIDLCLHIVTTDYGLKVANQVARRLVVPPVRSGRESQEMQAAVLPTTEAEAFSRLLDTLRADLSRRQTLEDAAKQVAMSPRTFLRRFQALTGTSYGAWMTLQRFERAKRLLAETDLPIERISEACGMASSGSLRRLFRQQTGASPSQYRKANLQRRAS